MVEAFDEARDGRRFFIVLSSFSVEGDENAVEMNEKDSTREVHFVSKIRSFLF